MSDDFLGGCVPPLVRCFCLFCFTFVLLFVSLFTFHFSHVSRFTFHVSLLFSRFSCFLHFSCFSHFSCFFCLSNLHATVSIWISCWLMGQQPKQLFTFSPANQAVNNLLTSSPFLGLLYLLTVSFWPPEGAGIPTFGVTICLTWGSESRWVLFLIIIGAMERG